MTDRVQMRGDRPPGFAPNGSSAGLGIVMLYWITVPALTCMALMPFGRSIFDFLFPALASPVLGLAIILPMIVGFRSRRHWGVVFFFWGTVAAIAILALSLLTITIALVATLHAPPPLIGLTWSASVVLLLLSTLLPFPLRVLRLQYWRPEAEPSSWEHGDERISPRVVRALGGRRR